MSRQIILFAVTALLLILACSCAFAQEQQDSNSKQRPPRSDGSSMPPRPMPSGGMPPKPHDSQMPPRPQPEHSGSMPPRPKPQQSRNKPPKKQQESNDSINTESNQDENNDRQSRQDDRGGFPLGMILAIIGGLVVIVSIMLACGVGITIIILRKKGYSISIQKKESHQPLREEEEMPSQFMAQVPIVYTATPVVHYPNLQENQQVSVN